MRSFKWYSILLAAVISVSGCFPMNVITAIAADAETIQSTEESDQPSDPSVNDALIENNETVEGKTAAENEYKIHDSGEVTEDAQSESQNEPGEIIENSDEDDSIEEKPVQEQAVEEQNDELESEEEQIIDQQSEEEATESLPIEGSLEFADAEEEVEEIGVIPDSGLSSEEMFTAYVDQVFGIKDETARKLKARRATAGSKLTGYNRAVYDYISSQLPLIESGERTSTIFTKKISDMGLEKSEWTFAELHSLGVTTILGEDGKLTNEAKQVIKEQVYDLNLIISALLVDHPYLLYWYNKTVESKLSPFSLSKLINSTDPENSKVSLSGNSTLKFPVLEEYAAGEYEVDPSIGQTVRDSAANAAGIVGQYAAEDDYDKLVSYRDEICDRTAYNYSAAYDDPDDDSDDNRYGNPWQLIWVFDNDPDTNVVCEGYSKAFKYLFDLSSFQNEIGCIIVSSDNHMWNLVSMEDDKNYLVDVTNCDGRTNRDTLFLAGGEGNPQTGYRVGGIRYVYDDDTHSVWSDEELTLCETKYCPCYKWYTSTTSCLAEGERVKTCSKCGKVVTEEIPLDDHLWNTDYTLISAPTYTEEGEKAIFCRVCGEIKEDSRTVIPVLEPTPIEDLTVTGVVDKTYTGEEITQDVVVMDGDKVLTEGTDYTIEYRNNVNASGAEHASVIITGILENGYSGSVSTEFNINKAKNSITANSIVKAYSNKDRTYSIGAKAVGGKLQYSSNSKDVTVNSSGKVTIKSRFLGKATVTITAADGNYEKVTKKITVKVVPTKTTILKAVSPNAGKITLNWTKCWVCTGYVIQYATKSDFSDGKGAWIKKRATLTTTLGSKVKGKKYYLRMRTYTTIDGVNYYSDWSNTMTVRVKK